MACETCQLAVFFPTRVLEITRRLDDLERLVRGIHMARFDKQGFQAERSDNNEGNLRGEGDPKSQGPQRGARTGVRSSWAVSCRSFNPDRVDRACIWQCNDAAPRNRYHNLYCGETTCSDTSSLSRIHLRSVASWNGSRWSDCRQRYPLHM